MQKYRFFARRERTRTHRKSGWTMIAIATRFHSIIKKNLGVAGLCLNSGEDILGVALIHKRTRRVVCERQTNVVALGVSSTRVGTLRVSHEHSPVVLVAHEVPLPVVVLDQEEDLASLRCVHEAKENLANLLCDERQRLDERLPTLLALRLDGEGTRIVSEVELVRTTSRLHHEVTYERAGSFEADA